MPSRLPPPQAGPPVLLPSGPHIGWTLAATLSLGLVLSFLPLPEALRPLPALRENPKETLLAAVTPPKKKKPVTPVQIDWDKEVAAEPMVFEELDLSDVEVEIAEVRPTEPEQLKAMAPEKRTAKDEADTRRWEVIIRKVEAAHTAVVDPCLDADCSKTALSAYFSALKALRGDEPKPVRVVTIGTSLIASDHITDTTRRLLQLRHGSGGLGFMFVDRPTRGAGRTVRSGTATEGWNIEKITDESPFATAGFTGVGFTALTPQTTRYDASGLRRAELFVVQQPGGGAIEVVADGQTIGRVDTEGPKNQHALERVGLPENSKDLTFRTRGGPVRLDGVALETELPGVTLDSLGLPGATAQVLLRENEKLFAEQLAARSPSLVVLMIGGNDAFDMSLNRYDAVKGRAWMQQMIERVKRAAPEASCLLASPPDAGIWRMDDTIAPRKQTQEVAAYMRELAEKNGCALWDMQAAMGGEGAIARWWDAGLMNRDLVHPLALGGDVLGYLFEAALERARVAHHKRHGRRPGSSPLPGEKARVRGQTSRRLRHGQTPPPRRYLENPEALSPFFARLRTLERAHIGRVAIVQIGASHTAAHFFTDETRKLLSDRFGGAGRGYVAAGKSSPRLEQAGVTRSLAGTWNVSDALKQRTSGLPWGLTGIRADGQPGARLLMSFEETSGNADDTSHLQLHYLEQPNQPPPEVTIDGTLVPIEQPPAAETGVRVLDFAAPGGKHQISVQNVGPGVLSLYGMSHELMKPGIIYDAFGLPGSTASVFAAYDQQALAVQLNARQPDLFVFFFGTNESALPPDRLDEMKNAYPQIFKTARRSAPDAACLILAPTDRMSARKKVWKEAESITEVVEAMREIARENGCAFWDTRAVMGGKGAIDVWRKQGLAHRDHVHLNPEGYRKLAGDLISELLRDYDAWSPPP